MMRLWHRLCALDGVERRALIEAVATLLTMRVALALLPLGSVRRRLAAQDARTPSPGAASAASIGWAVTAAARRLPGMTCLVQALAAQRMLQRAGRQATLRIGMRRAAAGTPLEGHAWVECDGRVIVGGATDLGRYAPLASPAPRVDLATVRHWIAGVLRHAAVLERPQSAADILAACRAEEVSPLVHHLARARADYAAWPAELRAGLASDARLAAARELPQGEAVRHALDALRRADVHPLLLKGTALAYSLYPAPSHRGRADTDLLIPASDVARARRALEHAGYGSPPYSAGRELFQQTPLVRTDALGLEHWIDLHWAVSAAKVFADTLTYDELWHDAASIPALGAAARAPGLVHSLLLACMHPVMHHRNAERLVWAYDIHLLAARLDAAQWQAFTRMAEEKRLCAVCAHGLDVSSQRLGTRVPSGVMASLRRSRREPSAAYLAPARGWTDELIADLGARTWGARLRLLREIALPSPEYMRASYGLAASAGAAFVLPLLYAHRGLRGLARLAYGRK